MAIAFARAEYKSRASGGNAVRSAAYNSRSEIRDERTGECFDFSHQAKAGDIHLGVLLPDGARADFVDPATLWNAAEKAERRKDSQVAREVVIALPKELGREDHIALARAFAEKHFVSKGVAAQVDIHAPDADGENWHAHILITTRRVTEQGLEAKKARDLDPVVVSKNGRAKVVSEEERWGQLWAEHQNEYFQAQGLDLRVDLTGAVSQEHLGPKRFRAPEAQEARDERAEAEARTLKAWRDPASVLDLMTRTRSTFTTADLDRELAKALPVEEERAAVRAAVLAHPALVRLRDADGAEIDRFSTVDVIAQERRTLADAASVAQRRHAVGAQQIVMAIASRTMRPDQLRACYAAWSGDGLVVIEGRAGVGKSYAIGAIAEGYSRSGYTVVGLGPTNLVGLELAAEAHVSRGGTLHSELWHVEQGKRVWDARTVVIVDEAAMVDSRTMGRLMTAAARSGAKVILVGDDRQLASVERGGLFSELRDRHGSVVIEKVTRQRQDWQREAAEDLAAGRHDRAVQAFADRGCIRWTQTQDEALAALVGQWANDTADRPGKSRFVFAYANDDVDKLNAALRLVRGLRGELGDDHALMTDRGSREFAVGDRVQITRTDKSVGMVNGTVGTITGIRGSHVMMRLDNGKTVAWNAEEFGGFRHGYAGTIYKGQGRTIDETYLYHSHHWRSAASYVALTRQRDSALVFAATETATDTAALARQMARADDRKAASAYVPEAEWFQARAQEEAARKVAEAEAQARAEAARVAEVEALRGLLADGRSIVATPERMVIDGLSQEQLAAVQRHWDSLWETAQSIAQTQAQAAAERRAALETVRALKAELAAVQAEGQWPRAGEITYALLPEAWKRLEDLDPAAAAAERQAEQDARAEETRRWQAEQAAAEAARKAQERPQASPAPVQPPPVQTAPTPRSAVQGRPVAPARDMSLKAREDRAFDLHQRATTPDALRDPLAIYVDAAVQLDDSLAAHRVEQLTGDTIAAARTHEVLIVLDTIRHAAAQQVLRVPAAREQALADGLLPKVVAFASTPPVHLAAQAPAPAPDAGAEMG